MSDIQTEEKTLTQEQKILTAGELKTYLYDIPENSPIIICVNGNFGYASRVEPAIASTWNNEAVWVIPKNEIDLAENIEFPIDKGLKNGDLVPVVFIKYEKPKQ